MSEMETIIISVLLCGLFFILLLYLYLRYCCRFADGKIGPSVWTDHSKTKGIDEGQLFHHFSQSLFAEEQKHCNDDDIKFANLEIGGGKYSSVNDTNSESLFDENEKDKDMMRHNASPVKGVEDKHYSKYYVTKHATSAAVSKENKTEDSQTLTQHFSRYYAALTLFQPVTTDASLQNQGISTTILHPQPNRSNSYKINEKGSIVQLNDEEKNHHHQPNHNYNDDDDFVEAFSTNNIKTINMNHTTLQYQRNDRNNSLHPPFPTDASVTTVSNTCSNNDNILSVEGSFQQPLPPTIT